ncbi:pilus assembly protein HicB [Muribaculaceae bacterium Isolate-007 (NCI)]|nr:pilus assembly protein HicB [Muribaculaceae bacterium Isolate-100 (HZI)]RXE66304.1 pilus assembly protein HicB [Muribaculaceae bacterium Isolate-007 (NCI)]
MDFNNFTQMKANIVFEMAKDGGCSCYMLEEVPDFGLLGYGDTPQEAKDDMLKAYEEIKGILIAEGKSPAELEFVYHYDMKSFFEYFDFLNVSKVAERAGINPSLMRKYTSGVANAGEGQYLKLQKAIHSIANELAAANF